MEKWWKERVKNEEWRMKNGKRVLRAANAKKRKRWKKLKDFLVFYTYFNIKGIILHYCDLSHVGHPLMAMCFLWLACGKGIRIDRQFTSLIVAAHTCARMGGLGLLRVRIIYECIPSRKIFSVFFNDLIANDSMGKSNIDE